MSYSVRDLIRLLQTARRSLSHRELLRQLDPAPEEREQLALDLERLEQAGAIRRHRGGVLTWQARAPVVTARLKQRRDGAGILLDPADDSQVLATLPARALSGAVHGDTVLALLQRKGRRTEAQLLAVLERPARRLIGRLAVMPMEVLFHPEDRRLPAVRLDNPEDARGADGELAAVEIAAGAAGPLLTGRLLECFGPPDELQAEVRSLAFKYELPVEFAPETLRAAEAIIWQPEAAAEPGRVDLRQVPLVTIDGETAKDFDDAVAIAPDGSGCRVWVAIADVSHYVAPGSAIDREARERGTSVYFPGTCLPMLPERLSNDLCSLIPDVERLAMVAEMDFDWEGHRTASRFYPALIRSRMRFTYTRVQQLLDGAEPAAAEFPLVPDLTRMRTLARQLHQRRLARGSLDFDLPESELVLDLQGQPEQILLAQRLEAHRLIEELMLAANRAVAEFLRQRQIPFLNRSHDAPAMDKLWAFQQLAACFGHGLTLVAPGGLQQELKTLLRQVEGRPEAHLLNRVLLRSMAQACYRPDRNGHFGLAFEEYCHFTSPIRRYPDLLIHRALRFALAGQGPRPDVETLVEEGEQSSLRERRAMEAEREIIQLKKCQYMQQHLGETFPGRISSVAAFGFFVELEAPPVEGMVPVASLGDDYYRFDPEHYCLVGERRRRRFQIGDKVTIIVTGIDLLQKDITFSLPQPATPRRPVTDPRRRRRQR